MEEMDVITFLKKKTSTIAREYQKNYRKVNKNKNKKVLIFGKQLLYNFTDLIMLLCF